MKKIREMMTILLIVGSVLLFMATLLVTINKYAGKPSLPFVISVSAVTATLVLLVASILALLIGYLFSKKGRSVTIISVLILMLNIYRLSEMITILRLIEKLELPYT